MGKKNGLLNNDAGELVLWCNGTEVMTFDSSKMSFFGATPTIQQLAIVDSTATNATDQKAPVNFVLVADETFGLVATS
jgi:hypothetical protein